MSGSTYFDLGTNWKDIMSKYNLTDQDMFELFNKLAIDDAILSGKTFKFSQDPRLLEYKNSPLAREWDYLMENYGYIDLKDDGGFYYAIK